MITEKLNFKDIVIVLKFSGSQLLSGFEMFTMLMLIFSSCDTV